MATKIKTIDIPLPATIDDLRIRHLKALTDPSFNAEDMNLNALVKFIANMTLLTVNEVMRCDKDDLINMYNHCMTLFAGYQLKGMPPKEITINGIEYEFVDPKKAPIAYHIDCEGSDFKNDPVRLACIHYIPKGTNYGDLDQNKNVLYPIASRYEDFKEHFKMIDYVELNAFFLLRLVRLIEQSEQVKKMENNLMKIRKMFGRGTR